jgi:hypothetical protein
MVTRMIFNGEQLGDLMAPLELSWKESSKINSILSPLARELYPSIGVLLCRDKDDEVVEYALSRNLSPTLIAQYQLQLPDKRLLQAKLHEHSAYDGDLGMYIQQG